MTKPASIERIPPSIPTKIPKEVNKDFQVLKIEETGSSKCWPKQIIHTDLQDRQ